MTEPGWYGAPQREGYLMWWTGSDWNRHAVVPVPVAELVAAGLGRATPTVAVYPLGAAPAPQAAAPAAPAENLAPRRASDLAGGLLGLPPAVWVIAVGMILVVIAAVSLM